MRQILIGITLLLTNVALAQTFDRSGNELTWLEGVWERTNVKPGQSGVEIWAKVNSDTWIGRGVSMRGSDTMFVEKLKIVRSDGKMFYVADVPENKGEVLFQFTSMTEAGFVCENPSHDFPKKIVYDLKSGVLTATVSGNGTSFDVIFERRH